MSVRGTCPGCHNGPRTLKRNKQTGGLMCKPCQKKRTPRKLYRCADCGLDKPAYGHRPDGKRVCSGCAAIRRYHDPRTWKVCSICGGDPKPVASRSKKRKPICHACYQKARYQPRSAKPRTRSKPPSPSKVGHGHPPPRPPNFQMAKIVPLQVDPDWKWCVECRAQRPNVIIYADKQGRCPKHGLAWLRQRAARRLVTP